SARQLVGQAAAAWLPLKARSRAARGEQRLGRRRSRAIVVRSVLKRPELSFREIGITLRGSDGLLHQDGLSGFVPFASIGASTRSSIVRQLRRQSKSGRAKPIVIQRGSARLRPSSSCHEGRRNEGTTQAEAARTGTSSRTRADGVAPRGGSVKSLSTSTARSR